MRCRGATDTDSAALPSIPGKTAMRSGACRGIAYPLSDAVPAAAGDGEM
jgi:hypothetical protein